MSLLNYLNYPLSILLFSLVLPKSGELPKRSSPLTLQYLEGILPSLDMNLLILEIFLYQTCGLFIEIDPLQEIAVIPDGPFFDPDIGLENERLA